MDDSTPDGSTREHSTPQRPHRSFLARALVAVALLGAFTMAGQQVAFADAGNGKGGGRSSVTSGESGQPQPLSNADQNTGGANNGGDCGAYCSTRDGSLAQNGQGKSGHEAGSKGRADNKFPPGQAPDGTDNNNGYECDGNKGIGVSNPAHTGCGTTPPPPPVECVSGTQVTLGWGGTELGIRHASLVESTTTTVSLLPGTYSVTLTSSDPNHEPGYQASQTQEQWYVVFVKGGSTEATTGTIADLPTEQTALTQNVGTVTLTGGDYSAVATHVLADTAWEGTNGTQHSVTPTSAVLTCV